MSSFLKNGIVYVRKKKRSKSKSFLYFLNNDNEFSQVQILMNDVRNFEPVKYHKRSSISFPDFLSNAELWLNDHANFEESIYADSFDFQEEGKFDVFTVQIPSSFDLSSSKVVHQQNKRHSLRHNRSQQPLIVKSDSALITKESSLHSMNQSSEISLTYQSSNSSSASIGHRISNIDQSSLLNTDDPAMLVRNHDSSCKCIIC